MSDDPGIFEIMHSMRSMRRLKKDPIPQEVLDKVLDAGIRAPSGMNSQPWAFLVMREDEDKQWFGERYNHWLLERFGDQIKVNDASTPMGRTVNAARHLGEHMHEAPVLLAVLGIRDWPFAVAEEDRKGLAPPNYGAVYPCVQNILLAARALGLGASLTTMHQMFEGDMRDYFGIPDTYGVVAVIPLGYPQGKFGPVTREPISVKTHYGRWGNHQT